MALLGTGILKGPFTDLKEYNSFDTAEDDQGNKIKQAVVPQAVVHLQLLKQTD